MKENKAVVGILTLSFLFLLSLCSHQIQQQAFLVLQENQVLIEKLEAKQDEAKASLSRHQSEGTLTWAEVKFMYKTEVMIGKNPPGPRHFCYWFCSLHLMVANPSLHLCSFQGV